MIIKYLVVIYKSCIVNYLETWTCVPWEEKYNPRIWEWCWTDAEKRKNFAKEIKGQLHHYWQLEKVIPKPFLDSKIGNPKVTIRQHLSELKTGTSKYTFEDVWDNVWMELWENISFDENSLWREIQSLKNLADWGNSSDTMYDSYNDDTLYMAMLKEHFIRWGLGSFPETIIDSPRAKLFERFAKDMNYYFKEPKYLNEVDRIQSGKEADDLLKD